MKGAYELGRAGFKYDQIMGSMKGMLNLALAGDIAIKESSDIATNILTAMRLPMKTVEQASDSLTRVNDALAYSASNSNTDVRMMGETFKYVGPMAAAAGMSIEQVAAASMVMARNGIRASEAGVAMRSALVRMVRPTKPMLQALSRMNIDIDKFVKGGRQISAQDVISSLAVDGIDASSFSKQIEQVLNDPSLNQSLSKLSAKLAEIIGGDGTAVDKSKLAETITDVLTAAGSEVDFFGFIRALREKGADLGDIARIFDARQGSRLITLLAGDLDKALSDVEKNSKGATDRMAKTMMKGIVGDWAEFEASVENLFVSIAESGVLKTASEAFKLAADGLKSRTVEPEAPRIRNLRPHDCGCTRANCHRRRRRDFILHVPSRYALARDEDRSWCAWGSRRCDGYLGRWRNRAGAAPQARRRALAQRRRKLASWKGCQGCRYHRHGLDDKGSARRRGPRGQPLGPYERYRRVDRKQDRHQPVKGWRKPACRAGSHTGRRPGA